MISIMARHFDQSDTSPLYPYDTYSMGISYGLRRGMTIPSPFTLYTYNHKSVPCTGNCASRSASAFRPTQTHSGPLHTGKISSALIMVELREKVATAVASSLESVSAAAVAVACTARRNSDVTSMRGLSAAAIAAFTMATMVLRDKARSERGMRKGVILRIKGAAATGLPTITMR